MVPIIPPMVNWAKTLDATVLNPMNKICLNVRTGFASHRHPTDGDFG